MRGVRGSFSTARTASWKISSRFSFFIAEHSTNAYALILFFSFLPSLWVMNLSEFGIRRSLFVPEMKNIKNVVGKKNWVNKEQVACESTCQLEWLEHWVKNAEFLGTISSECYRMTFGLRWNSITGNNPCWGNRVDEVAHNLLGLFIDREKFISNYFFFDKKKAKLIVTCCVP